MSVLFLAAEGKGVDGRVVEEGGGAEIDLSFRRRGRKMSIFNDRHLFGTAYRVAGRTPAAPK
jgi:hypothetical protein